MVGRPMSRMTASGGRTAISSRACGPVGGQGDLVALEAEGPVERPAHGRIVIDDEDSHRAGSLSGSCPIAVARRSVAVVRRALTVRPASARAGTGRWVRMPRSSLERSPGWVRWPFRGSSIGRTLAFGARCWRFEPSPRSVPNGSRVGAAGPGARTPRRVNPGDRLIRAPPWLAWWLWSTPPYTHGAGCSGKWLVTGIRSPSRPQINTAHGLRRRPWAPPEVGERSSGTST